MFNMIYKALVRPQVEYATPVWSPTLKMDINAIERVQHRATKLIPGIASLSYEERLQHLKLPTLQYCLICQDLIFIFKHTHQLLDLDTKTQCPVCPPDHDMLTPTLRLNTRGHAHKFQIHHHQGARNKSSRVLKIWNNLDKNTVQVSTVNAFKNKISTDLALPNKYIPF